MFRLVQTELISWQVFSNVTSKLLFNSNLTAQQSADPTQVLFYCGGRSNLRLISETLLAVQGDTVNVLLSAGAVALTSHLEKAPLNSMRSAEHSG